MSLAEAIGAYDNYLRKQGYSSDLGWSLFTMIDYFFMVTRHREGYSEYELQITDFNQESVNECFDIAIRYMKPDKLKNLAIALNDFHRFLKRCEKEEKWRKKYFDDFGMTFSSSGLIEAITFPYDDEELAISEISHNWEIKSGMGWSIR